MSMLFNEVSSFVSPQYHRRLREVLTVVDRSLKYKIRSTKNAESLKTQIHAAMRDNRGFKYLTSFAMVLTGDATIYPYVRINSEFVIVLVQNKMVNPTTGKVKESNYIMVYEKSATTLAGKLGGIVNASLHS